MSSLGYVMMNWSSELLKQAKGKNRRKFKKSEQEESEEHQRGKEDRATCTEEDGTVQEAVERLSLLESELSQALEQNGILKDRLEKMKSTLGASFERENRLRSENESSTLQEAQLRFEMKEIRKTLEEELHKRDQEHEQQIHMMEQLMSEKDYAWSCQQESLKNDLGNAIRANAEQKNIENMSRAQLEQELSSLAAVIDLRSKEIQELRDRNQELSKRLERHYWLESELNKARQRVEEMSLVVQNKMIAEKELMSMAEGLTNDLSRARQEILQLKRNDENRIYLQSKCEGLEAVLESQDNENNKQNQHRNQHQKASYGGSVVSDPTLILGLVEKEESVSWMLHMPDSPKITRWK